MTEPRTIDQILFALEEEMHSHLDSPVKGDLMSLTRSWRQILEDWQSSKKVTPRRRYQ